MQNTKESANQPAEVQIKAFDKKVIYVYKHLDVASHKGMLKVGETKASNIKGDGTNMRILDQNTAANVAYEVLYTTDAVRNNGTPFTDKDIHELLVAKDIEREQTINPNTDKESEWFKTDLQTIINTIEEYKLQAVKDEHGIITDFRLRDEQIAAIKTTEDYYDACKENVNLEPAFLWNAKPRFGKTLTAYCFASEIQAKKVLIVTNRPAIADSWHTDFELFDFKDTDQNDGKFRWIFTCSEAVKNRLGNPRDVFTRDEQTTSSLLNMNLITKNMVHFISLQDIKGRNQGIDDFKEKNKWIFDLDWDLVIIDESHEGVDTHKAMRVFDTVKTTFTLNLSGTPFKALASKRFNSNQIYNWSYQDEQRCKENWPIQDGTNPYADLPKMHIFTYQLSKALETTAEEARDEGSEYAFDLAEFFRVVKVDGKDKFAYEDKVKLFVKNLRNPNYQYPFSSDEFRENLRHTFWLLPGVKACEQMKKILLQDEWFGANYQPEDIIMAAGNGDEDRITESALAEVRQRIGEPGTSRHPLETRTITLSCGQLTTGVTVPAWTAVLMLNNCKSPSMYMQSAFRSQNPFKIVTSGGECFMKENCFVFDFAPDRILQTLAEIADSGVSDTPPKPREEKVKILINFLPVIAEDSEGKMKYLDANDVLTIPLKLITEEVINRGFMSNRLFKNISGIFGCPQDIKDIISKMDEAKGTDVEKDPTKKPKITNKPKIWVDADKKIHINEDIVVATTNGLLGDKKYVEIGSEDGREIEETIGEAVSQARAAGYPPEAIKAVKAALVKKMPKLVVKIPDPEPQPGDPGYVEPPEKPDEKPAPKEKSDEEKIRDRLRGFARTIPSFLMAYGTSDTKLENFGDDIPDDVFEELTNITKEDFRKLRDGMDYEAKDEKGNPKTEHFNGLFDEAVFNSAVQEFNNKRKELACYYQTSSEEDIFEYIPPQANNQIFTPKRVVKMMVDMLEKENPDIFNSTTNTFIDLYMKSGMFITEIVKRIYEKTRDNEQYHSDTECIKHILEKQVYGFAPSPILDAITRNYIFGFGSTEFIDESHFIQYDAIEATKNGALEQEINKLFNSQGEPMKFTAVIGNPPYQGDNHFQLYPDFYLSSRKLGEKSILIFPTGWQEPKNALNLQKMNTKEIKEDKQIVKIDNRQNVFPGITGAEWTNIILWQHGYDNQLNGRQLVYTNGEKPEAKQLLWDKTNIEQKAPAELKRILSHFIKDEKNNLPSIIYSGRSVLKFNDNFLKKFPDSKEIRLRAIQQKQPNTLSLGPNEEYELKTSTFEVLDKVFIDKDPSNEKEYYKLYGSYKNKRTVRWIKRDYMEPRYRNRNNIDYYKVLIAKAASAGDFGAKISDTIIAKPGESCTPTFYGIGYFNTFSEAYNCDKYIKTKLFRALLGALKTTRDNPAPVFAYIPMQDFTNNSDIDWSKTIPEIDKQLYKKYNLSEEEIKFIEEKVAAME